MDGQVRRLRLSILIILGWRVFPAAAAPGSQIVMVIWKPARPNLAGFLASEPRRSPFLKSPKLSRKSRFRRESNGKPRRVSVRCSPNCHRVRCRLQEKTARATRKLERLQTASRRRLRPNPSVLRADLGFRPRQSGRHSLDDHDQRPRRLSLRSDGCGLRRRRHSRPRTGARPYADHRSKLPRPA